MTLVWALVAILVIALIIGFARATVANQPPSPPNFSDAVITFQAVSEENQRGFRQAQQLVADFGIPHPTNRLFIQGDYPLPRNTVGATVGDTIRVHGNKSISATTWVHEIFHGFQCRTAYMLEDPVILANQTKVIGFQGFRIICAGSAGNPDYCWDAWEEGAAEYFASSITKNTDTASLYYQHCAQKVGGHLFGSRLSEANLLGYQTKPGGLLILARVLYPERSDKDALWAMVNDFPCRPGEPRTY